MVDDDVVAFVFSALWDQEWSIAIDVIEVILQNSICDKYCTAHEMAPRETVCRNKTVCRNSKFDPTHLTFCFSPVDKPCVVRYVYFPLLAHLPTCYDSFPPITFLHCKMGEYGS